MLNLPQHLYVELYLCFYEHWKTANEIKYMGAWEQMGGTHVAMEINQCSPWILHMITHSNVDT